MFSTNRLLRFLAEDYRYSGTKIALFVLRSYLHGRFSMILFAYLATYLICASFIIFIFSCACELGDSKKDRRKKDRRKKIRQNFVDRRVSNEFHSHSISEADDIPVIQ